MSGPNPRLRLDKSRYFSTIHGQRVPDDPHQHSHFLQDGIHFDAEGLHLDHLVDDEKTRALVDRRLKRQVKAAPKADDAGGSVDDDDVNDQGGGQSDEVNLEAWLRGTAKYPWFNVTKAVRDRYSSNITKQVDMVDFLVNEAKLVPIDEVDEQLAA